MTAHKPSQADQGHIDTAAYWREQNASSKRTAKLRAARLAKEKAEPPKPKRKVSTAAIARPKGLIGDHRALSSLRTSRRGFSPHRPPSFVAAPEYLNLKLLDRHLDTLSRVRRATWR